MLNFKIIAVDFDGTLCENKWPETGEPNNEIIDYIKKEKENGAKIILWTCRFGDELINAISWCFDRGLMFDVVNENIKEAIEEFGGDTRKIFAHEYIDDKSSHQFDLPFIKREIGVTDDVIRKLELVFGFPLYDWQKQYLKGNTMAMPKTGRRNGKTFAYCIRILLDRWFAKPIDFLDPRAIKQLAGESHGRPYNDFFFRYLLELNDKLVDAGFTTNTKTTTLDTFCAENETIKTIEHFLSKDDPRMEFKEMQSVVKMQYEIYKKMMQPITILNTYNNGGK